MKLREYLFYNEITAVDFCQTIGYAAVTIRGYLTGRVRISPRLALVISKATKGKCSPDELLLDNPGKKIDKRKKMKKK